MKNKLLFTAILFAIATNTFSQVPNYVPTNGLVGWWPFNGNAIDESINTNDGIVNGATLTSDRNGAANSAYSFDGINDFISIPDNNSLDFTTTYTISVWVEIPDYSTPQFPNGSGDTDGVRTILGKPRASGWTTGYSINSVYEGLSNNFSHAINDGTSQSIVASNSPLPLNSWINIIAVKTPTNISLYRNSVLEQTINTTLTLTNSSEPIYIGKEFTNTGIDWYRWFKGKIDDVSIFNRALLSCEIQSLYTGILPNTSVNAGADQAICAGTPVTLSATGASTYIWNNAVTNGVSFTPTSTTTYSVTGTDANGCIGTDQVLVTVNALPTVNAGIDQTVCAGTSVTLSGSGANTYSWNNSVSNGVGFTPASTITYTVTGTNTLTGCTNTDQAVVSVNALPTVNAGTDQTVCAGTSVTLSGTGADTYSWNNSVSNGVSFNPTVSNEYVATGADVNGCLGTDTVNITVNNPSTSTLTETALDSYTLNNQTYTQSGTYTQVIPNAAGCDSTITLNLTLNFTGITELKDGIRIYPNPTFDNLTIERTSSLNSNYVLVDSQGRLVLQGELTETITHLSLGKLEYGNYILQLENQSVPIRIVKQ